MAAKLLHERRADLAGNVKFMFQPAEEGPGGAGPMIEAGLLKNPDVDYALATHMWNDLPTGRLGVRPGPVFAAVDEFVMTVRGRGGHGAAPDQTVDPIAIASMIVMGFQNVVARKINPIKPSVITIGKIEAGTKHNIIPDTATLYGTVRSMEPGVRKGLQRWIHQTATGIARAFGATIDVRYSGLYPATVNDPSITARVRRVAESIVGRANVVEQDITMGAEDMSLVLQEVPGCYFLLGSKNSRKGLDHPHHSARFDFDEAALPLGVETTIKCALDLLNGK